MQVKRKELIDALEICEPALATANRAIEMGHYWFADNQISAFNGHLTITAPFELEVEGGVPHTFLDWLGKVSGDQVTLKPESNALAVTSGRSRYSFPLLDPERRIKPLSRREPSTMREPLSLSSEIVEGLSRVIISHDSKSAVPAKMGVFLHSASDSLELYSTDDFTLAEQTLDPQGWHLFDNTLSDFIVVPISFIRQLFKHLPLGGRDCLHLTANAISFTTKGITVTGNLIACEKMPDFPRIIDGFAGAEIAVPAELEQALDRVAIKDAPVAFSINKELLYLISLSQSSRIEEEILLPSHQHETIMIKLDPKLLKRGLPGRTHMSVTNNGMRLRGPAGYTHIIAAVPS